MTTNTKPKNGDGLDAPHDQPAEISNKSTRILGAIRAIIRRAASGFTLGRCMDAYTVLMLALVAILLIQGAATWMH